MASTQTLMMTCPPKMAAKYAEILLGCYRRGEAEDGPTYARAVVAVLTAYPETIVRRITDPRTGLPGKSQFLPTIYEIRSACEAAMRPIVEAERQRHIAAANAADRPAEISAEASERRREFIANRREFIANWWAAQAVHGATEADVETPLAEMDARQCQGEHRELVTKALDAKIAQLKAASISTPLKLSDAAVAIHGAQRQ